MGIAHYKKLADCIEFREGIPYRTKTTSSRAQKGTVAGYIDRLGYRTIRVSVGKDSKLLFAHRLYWFMKYGYIPKEVDHIDGDPSNNRIENLREVTHRQNLYNTRHRKNTTSRYRGVHRHKLTGRWRAQLKTEGRTISLGLFDTEEEAGEAYNRAVVDNGLEEFVKLNEI